MERLGDTGSVTAEAQWRVEPLSAWPGNLPLGIGGDWEGWSAVPDVSKTWDDASRALVREVLQSQYAQAGLSLPESWHDLERPNCRTVTVGHQLVLAGGPAFFHHKILTAIRVARGLSTRADQPVVPVFWMASEDHDWKEIATVHGKRQAHSWTPSDADVPFPVGQLSLDGMRGVLEAWMQDGVEASVAEGMRADCLKAHEEGESLSGLMRRWLTRWYGSEGLLVLDAHDARLKRHGALLWSQEFEGHGVHEALRHSDAMEGPAHVRENSVFWMDPDHGRHGVIRDAETGGWQAGTHSFEKPATGWSSWAEKHAFSCSPGVLLRPLYQELLLQSAAVILGPGEWGYWHQLPMAFAHHGLDFPALRMRDHGVVVSPAARECGWTLSEGWLHNEAWDRWVLDKWMAPLEGDLTRHEAMLIQWHRDVQTWANDIAPELQGPSGAMEAAMAKAWRQWNAKVRKAIKGRRSREWAAARLACESLVRQGLPQDRWANWHVLAGDRAGAWKAAWLSEETTLKAVIWVLEDRIEEMNEVAENSSP